MTREDKQLLLVDLCARLPYAPICHITDENGISIDEMLTTSTLSHLIDCGWSVKPYLRPLSSMTGEEQAEMKRLLSPNGTAIFEDDGIAIPMTHIGDFVPYDFMVKILAWLYAHDFDVSGLIEKGLALNRSELSK